MLPWQRPFIIEYSRWLAESFSQWTVCALVSCHPEPVEGSLRSFDSASASLRMTRALYHAPFVLVSHGTEPDPVFCYANLAAQELWGMEWEIFTALPSRLSAEPEAQDERERLLQRAAQQGYVDNYQGVRITADGRRFRIRDCILWNVVNETGDKIGQAAKFDQWEWL